MEVAYKNTEEYLENRIANQGFYTDEWIQRAYSGVIFEFVENYIKGLNGGEIMPYEIDEDIEIVWNDLKTGIDLIKYKGNPLAKVILKPPYTGKPNIEFELLTP